MSGPGDSYHLKGGPGAAAGVDAYLEYRRIVGDDDGGTLFTPEEYEAYKKEKLPQRLNNRLFVSWTNPAGMDCKLVGPETPCFCTHRYKQHRTDFAVLPEDRPIMLPCKVKGCKCITYKYVPLNGTQPIRCRCKHFADEHSEAGNLKCKNAKCSTCQGFHSSYTCGCGEATYKHQTIVDTRDEREAKGKPVGMDGVPYQAMGGITGFSSLADGYMRIDPSGHIEQSEQWLDQPVTASDHPFLRANLGAIEAQRQMQGLQLKDSDKSAMDSAARRPGETDMDFFERRYQERQRESKVYRPALKGRGAKK